MFIGRACHLDHGDVESWSWNPIPRSSQQDITDYYFGTGVVMVVQCILPGLGRCALVMLDILSHAGSTIDGSRTY
eukprot:scaffold44_cov411-Prasinococcus_capsulatus_cf.AAC.53